MKGWREHAADIFAKHGEIAAKMKSAPGPVPSDFQQSQTLGCPPYCLRQLLGERPVAVVKAMRNEELWL